MRVTDRRFALGLVVLAVVAFAAYLSGAARVFAYDEAVSFAYYVATPSPFDPFGRSEYLGVPLWQVATNNHPLFNFLEHLVYSATGTRSEWAYRVLPAACGALTVVLTGLLLRERFERPAAAAGALFLATNPLFADESHVMRGYTLLLLLTLVSAVSLRALWRTGSRRWAAAFAIASALGVLVHVYMTLVIAGEVVAAWRARRLRATLPPAVAGGLAGTLGYAGLLGQLVQHTRDQGHIFRPDFPIQVLAYLYGGPYPVFALFLALALLGLFAVRREGTLWLLAGFYTLVLAGVWAVAQPAELYPRFFMFLLPAAAYLVAASVSRWPYLVLLVGAGCLVAVGFQAPTYNQPQLALREAAQVLESNRGGCAIPLDQQVLPAYTTSYTLARTPGDLDACAYVVVVTWNLAPAMADAVSTEFPHRRVLPAAYPGLVLTR